MQLTHTTFGHTLGNIPHSSFLLFMIKSYLNVKTIIFQKGVGHLLPAQAFFQSQVPCGYKAS